MKVIDTIDVIVRAPWRWRISGALLFFISPLMLAAQDKTKDWEGALDAVEIEIVKERQITLPKASRNFEKIPPRASEPIKPPITYDFRAFTFQTPQINPQLRPLKLKTEDPSKVYGSYVSVGYGNYVSPYLEAFINSRKDKNKLVGAHAYLNSSDKGPVDGKNSGGGLAGISVYGSSFSESFSVSGNAGFERRSTHFYGYVPGSTVEAADIKQTFDLFKLGAEVANARNSDFAFKLGGGFSYLADKFDARETEVDFDFQSGYKIDDDKRIKIDATYNIITRKDVLIEAKPRHLFSVNPAYVFSPIENLKLTVGLVGAFENDTIDSKNLHLYPDFRATYPISPSVNIIGSLTGGMEKVSLQSLSNENLWLAPNAGIFHTNKVFDLAFGMQAKVGNKVSVDAGLSMASLRNWYFFTNTNEDQAKFNTIYDKGLTKRSNLYASLGFTEANRAKFLLRGDYFAYTTDKVEEAWHRPTYKLTLDASYNVYDKILLTANLITQGGMKAREPVTLITTKLDAAFDLNAGVEYLFSDSFSFFVKFNNITSNKYPVFLNYPVRGFQVLGGITWSF
ncbi:MAG: hypothetical protein JNM57_08055 [Cyclobacteriaceae bacterium]|nr:hypothetical protein [Cyclobacteriaceae bacterium]